MKTRLIFSTIALAIAGWCHATGYTLTLYADGCESANVITCNVRQWVLIMTVPENEHRHFVRWTDDYTDNPRLVMFTQDTTFTAVFADDPILTLVSSNDNWGKVSGAGQFKPNWFCEISATANYGYHFTQWSDGNTDNPRTVWIYQDITLTAEFAPNQYTITTYAQHGSVNGGGTYDYGTTATLTATADAHYHFTQWTDGNTDNPRTISIEGDATYTAEFKPNSYTITVSADGYGSANGGGTYDYGTTATLTATAAEHYHFTQWSDGNTNNPRTISVKGDAAYTAEFAIDQHTITTNAQNGNVNGGGTYDYGTTATLSATANEHYHFTRWTDGNTDNPRTVSVESDATYTAEFKPNSYTITVSTDGHGSANGSGTYDYGTTATLSATANEHYHFTRWTDGNTDNPRTVSVESDATYTAEFKPNSYTITVSTDGHGSANGSGTYDYGTTATLSATANEHYHFTRWTDGNTDNPRTVSVVGDATYTAEFKPNSYTITVSTDGYGSANGGGTYDYGTTATLTATADEHYHFTQWSDGNTDNPRTLLVEGNTTYTAEFAIDQFTISATGEHGHIEGTGTYDYGTTATLTATANEHYHFTQWSDGNTDNPRMVSVVGDVTYTAEFAIDQHTITTNAHDGTITGGGTYDYGTTATLTATANEHYHFTQWSDGNTDNPRMVSVVGDATYTAEFAIDQHTIAATCDPQQGTVTGAGIYDYGTQVTLTATANKGYEFAQWSNGATYNPYLFIATADLTLEAQFVPATAVDNVSADGTTPQKIIRDGQVYILRNGKTYTTTGVEVK